MMTTIRGGVLASSEHDPTGRLLADTFINAVEHRRKCASTNDVAAELLRKAKVAVPFLVCTDRQTGGRGRGANRWWSAEGALTFSVVVDDNTFGIRVGRDSRIAIAAGLAVAQTLRSSADDAHVSVKWPNDVWLEGRKVCGILVEVTGHRSDAAVIGIGLNINNSLATAPEEIRNSATSLADATGRQHDCDEILISLLQNLDDQLRRLSSPDDDLAARWEEQCALTGRFVRVQDGEREHAGKCHGIDVAGALLLQKGTALHRIVAGSVVEIGD